MRSDNIFQPSHYRRWDIGIAKDNVARRAELRRSRLQSFSDVAVRTQLAVYRRGPTPLPRKPRLGRRIT